MKETLTLQFDGGSRGNPGPAGIGVVVSTADGTPLVTLGRYIGVATNNVAEYTGVITALEEAKKLGATKIIIRGDSELIIKQLKGEYRVKHPDMQRLYARAIDLIDQFDEVTITHNLRSKNEIADRLANLAMDKKRDVTEDAGGSAPSPLDEPAPTEWKAGDTFACPKCGCVLKVEKPSSVRPHQLKPPVCFCGTKMNET